MGEYLRLTRVITAALICPGDIQLPTLLTYTVHYKPTKMKWELSVVAFLATLAAAAPQQKGAVNDAANNGDGVSLLLTPLNKHVFNGW